MKKIFIILIIFLFSNRCYSLDLTRTIGGRVAAMGRTSVCEQSLWALQNNPAGLAYLTGWHFGIYYENQWLLRETAFKSGGVTKAFNGIGCFGLSISQFGSSNYNENKFGIAYARDFGPYLQLGLQFDYLLLHQGEPYPNRGSLGFELGVQSQVTQRLRLGAYLFNTLVLRFGLSYQIADNFIAQCELEKDREKTGMQVRCGFEYTVFKAFSLRAGAQYNPKILSFGAGYAFKHVTVDVAGQLHQLLGASLQIGITGFI